MVDDTYRSNHQTFDAAAVLPAAMHGRDDVKKARRLVVVHEGSAMQCVPFLRTFTCHNTALQHVMCVCMTCMHAFLVAATPLLPSIACLC